MTNHYETLDCNVVNGWQRAADWWRGPLVRWGDLRSACGKEGNNRPTAAANSLLVFGVVAAGELRQRPVPHILELLVDADA